MRWSLSGSRARDQHRVGPRPIIKDLVPWAGGLLWVLFSQEGLRTFWMDSSTPSSANLIPSQPGFRDGLPRVPNLALRSWVLLRGWRRSLGWPLNSGLPLPNFFCQKLFQVDRKLDKDFLITDYMSIYHACLYWFYLIEHFIIHCRIFFCCLNVSIKLLADWIHQTWFIYLLIASFLSTSISELWAGLNC